MRLINEYLIQASKVHSTQLNEYLLSKKNAKKPKLAFPSKPVRDDVVDFLKDNGFEEIENEYGVDFFKLMRDAQKIAGENRSGFIQETKDKAYQRNGVDNYIWIRFWLGGKICRDNPVFFVRVTEDGSNPNTGIPAFIEWSTNDDQAYSNYEAFRQDVNKHLDLHE